MNTITNPVAFADGWIARELEDWDARSKDEIRDSLTALRRSIGPHLLSGESVDDEAAVDELTELVRAIHRATRDDEISECWTIRAFLEQRGVYDGNLTGSRRLVAEACRLVLDTLDR